MADDWRVTLTLDGRDDPRDILAALHEHEAADDLRDELGERVAVSSDGPTSFLYAGTRRAAEAALRTLTEGLTKQGATATEPQLDHWHPIEEEWEDASVPLPQSDDERRAERERLDADDDATSLATG